MKDALLACLDDQRRHVLGIVAGLEEEALRRPVLPSGWTCLGLIRHLTADVERFWFEAVVAGDPAAAGAGNAWEVGPETPAQDVLDGYRRACEAASAALRGVASLDAPPAWWPPGRFGDWRVDTVREVVLHVIAETACHAGHLDAARELIDGRLWYVQTS